MEARIRRRQHEQHEEETRLQPMTDEADRTEMQARIDAARSLSSRGSNINATSRRSAPRTPPKRKTVEVSLKTPNLEETKIDGHQTHAHVGRSGRLAG